MAFTDKNTIQPLKPPQTEAQKRIISIPGDNTGQPFGLPGIPHRRLPPMRQEVIHVDAENLQHGLSAPNVAGGDEHMVVVRTNKRIDKVLEKYKRGNRSAKTIELHDFIMAYKANTEQAVTRCILEYLQSVNKDNPDSAAGDARRSFMVWTSQNVDRALQNYVRDEYA